MFSGVVPHSPCFGVFLVLLPSEGAPSGSLAFPTVGWQRTVEHRTNYPLCMAQDGGDFIGSWPFHIHEVGTGLCTRRLFLCFLSSSGEGGRGSLARGTCRGEVITARLNVHILVLHYVFSNITHGKARSTDKSSRLRLWSWTIKGNLFQLKDLFFKINMEASPDSPLPPQTQLNLLNHSFITLFCIC